MITDLIEPQSGVDGDVLVEPGDDEQKLPCPRQLDKLSGVFWVVD